MVPTVFFLILLSYLFHNAPLFLHQSTNTSLLLLTFFPPPPLWPAQFGVGFEKHLLAVIIWAWSGRYPLSRNVTSDICCSSISTVVVITSLPGLSPRTVDSGLGGQCPSNAFIEKNGFSIENGSHHGFTSSSLPSSSQPYTHSTPHVVQHRSSHWCPIH